MNLGLAVSTASVGLAGTLSPRWGAAVALPLFARVSQPRRVSPDDQPTIWRARRTTVRIAGLERRGVDVTLYEWGSGSRTVALAHGWDGRASQFSRLVRELVAEGYLVVAFDAPAHGDTPGRRTYLVDWLDVLAAIEQRHGRLDAVVGHSFGGLAALVGVAGGLRADRVVTIAAPADAAEMLHQFQLTLRISDAVAAAMRERFALSYFPGDPDPFAWLSAVRRPLPAGTSLLAVHDERDRLVPFSEAHRIVSANPGATLLATTGLGHNRVLADDAVLDAVLAQLAAPAPAAPALADGGAAPTPRSAADARAVGYGVEKAVPAAV